jgi:hypothetical protein
MAWSDWIDVELQKAIVRHTIDAASAIISFASISFLVRHFVENPIVALWLDRIEELLLVVVFVVFVAKIGYDICKVIRYGSRN